MPISKKAYVVMFLVGGATIALMASASKASAKSVTPKPPGTKPPGEGDITVQPPGPSGVPDGTTPPITVHTDDSGNVTGVTVESDKPQTPGLPGQPGSFPGSQPPAGSVVTTIPGPPVGGTPSPVPGITDQAPSPIAAQEVQPQNDPNGTVMLARVMLARETAKDWKADLQPDIARWQKIVGLKNDGKFGPKSVEKMAEEVAVLPLVRYWSQPVYNKATAQKAHKEMLARVIAKLTPLLPMSDYHITALKGLADREAGQALAKNPPPAATLEDVNALFTKFIDPKAVAAGKQAVS